MLLGHGENRKAGRSESVRPSGERVEEIRQERRIQHDVAGNVADDGFVEHSISCAQHRLAVAEKIPGQSDARCEVVVVGIVDRTHIRLQDHTRGTQCIEIALNGGIAWIEILSEVLRPETAQPPVRFVQHGVQFVAQAIVQCHILAHFEAVLAEESVAGGAEIPMGISDELKGAAGKPFGKINQRVGNILGIVRVTIIRRIQCAAECDLPAEGEIIKPVELRVPDIGAHLEAVACRGMGDVIHPLERVIGSPIGLINSSAKICDCCASRDKAAGEGKLRNISQAQLELRLAIPC